MAPPEHPLKKRVLELMTAGLATSGEIAKTGEVPIGTLMVWRHRLKLKAKDLRDARIERVRKILLEKGE